MEEGVRPAGPDDAQVFLELSWQFFNGLVRQRGGPLLVANRGGLEGVFDFGSFDDLLADPHRVVLLGTLDDAVVGMAIAHASDLEDGTRLGRIDGCIVDEGARGIGIGRLLLDAVCEWCREQGCAGVDGTSLPGDRAAKSFFEGAGFKARLITMHRSFA